MATGGGRVVVITGSGSGIGRATALLFAASGARVAVNDLNAAAAAAVAGEIVDRGGVAADHAADVTDPDAVNVMFSNIQERFGEVDVLVNNAGLLRSTRLEEIAPPEWDDVLRVNLTSAFLCSKAVLPSMRARRFGKIVNIASLAGRATSTLGGAHYTAAKAGLLGLSRHLAREYAPHRINVNAVCPGIVDTPMARSVLTPDTRRRLETTIPFGRLAEPEEIAQLVLFLASDLASYITGAAVDIHGGELIIQ